MAKGVKTSYKVKGREMSKAQKMQRATVRDRISSRNSKLFDQTSKGIGKYAKKSNANLSNRQAYNLEKMALRNEKLGLNTKPAVIKAAGEALAMNITPSLTGFGSGAGAAKVIEASNKNQSNTSINSLINGGVGRAGTENEEEMLENNTNPGGYTVR